VAVRLDVVGIAVKDMAASLRFYRALGIPVPEGQDAEGHVDVEASGIPSRTWTRPMPGSWHSATGDTEHRGMPFGDSTMPSSKIRMET
jgi:catechol 2,3-dioxygenase-like lactoylglutathione lyase family enzyme